MIINVFSFLHLLISPQYNILCLVDIVFVICDAQNKILLSFLCASHFFPAASVTILWSIIATSTERNGQITYQQFQKSNLALMLPSKCSRWAFRIFLKFAFFAKIFKSIGHSNKIPYANWRWYISSLVTQQLEFMKKQHGFL